MTLLKRLDALEQAKAGTAIQVPKTTGERAIALTGYLMSCRGRYPHLRPLPGDDDGWWPFETGKPNTVRDDAIESLARAGDPVVQLLLKALARKNAAEGHDLL
ncbi:hypothetical protein PQR75_13630 [Paraburkholderia fungorum]|uniref:hypothetical protein n=1 Tax=Paraburkholderia fungorum TaxID=134537 RepID=UPI0038BCD5F2